MEFDIIVVIFIVFGEGVIVIVWVSGDDVVEKVDCIFKGKDLIEVFFYIIYYGYIVDLDIN